MGPHSTMSCLSKLKQDIWRLRIILHHNHTVSNDFIISVGVVGIIMVMVFLMNMVTIGGIKFRKYCTNIRLKFIKKQK